MSVIPKTIDQSHIPLWLQENSVDEFVETIKTYFEEDELVKMKDQSFKLGKQVLDLEDTLKLVSDHLKKGAELELNIDLPTGKGLTELKKERTKLDREIIKGYSEEDVKVYAIPGEDDLMYYFTREGEELEARRRPLSARESQEHNGLFGSFETEDLKVTVTKAS